MPYIVRPEDLSPLHPQGQLDAVVLTFIVLVCILMTFFVVAGEGTGLLRLHSTYRHDLKIYSSDEGRVQV